jgi:hypothetical protein
MEGQRKEDETTANTDNVVDLFGHTIPRRTQPPGTDEELAEYRKWRPALMLLARNSDALMELLETMEKLKRKDTGCPVMQDILSRP